MKNTSWRINSDIWPHESTQTGLKLNSNLTQIELNGIHSWLKHYPVLTRAPRVIENIFLVAILITWILEQPVIRIQFFLQISESFKILARKLFYD